MAGTLSSECSSSLLPSLQSSAAFPTKSWHMEKFSADFCQVELVSLRIFIFFIFDLLGFKIEPRKIRIRRVKGKKKKGKTVESSFHSFSESWPSEQWFQPTRLQVATLRVLKYFAHQSVKLLRDFHTAARRGLPPGWSHLCTPASALVLLSGAVRSHYSTAD